MSDAMFLFAFMLGLLAGVIMMIFMDDIDKRKAAKKAAEFDPPE